MCAFLRHMIYDSHVGSEVADIVALEFFILENQTSAALILRVHRPHSPKKIQNKNVQHRLLWSLVVLMSIIGCFYTNIGRF